MIFANLEMAVRFVQTISFITLISATSVFATFGDLDTTFGNNGEIIFFQPSNGYTGYAYGAVRQSDGKIIVVGAALTPSPNQTNILTIRRYSSNGTLDTSYGFSGTAIPYASTGYGLYAVVQSDGKLLVVGKGMVNSIDSVLVWRFNTNGVYDSTFGNNGRVNLGQGSIGGRIAVYKTAANSSTEYILVGNNGVRRLNPNGSPSTTFGTGGVIYGAGSKFVVKSATQFENSSIVIADRPGITDLVLSGFDGSGQVNSSFGINGTTSTYYGQGFYLTDVIRSPQGKIVLSGKIFGGVDGYGFISSHSSNGILDTQTISSSMENEVSVIKANPDGTVVGRQHGAFTMRKFASNLSPLFATTSYICGDLIIQPDSKILCLVYNRVARYLQ